MIKDYEFPRDKTKRITFTWDVQVNVIYRSIMDIPAHLLEEINKPELIQYIEDNIQFGTLFSEYKLQDWDYDTAVIHEDSIKEGEEL